jgi:APA family basic amino acid/polyamine antiporter
MAEPELKRNLGLTSAVMITVGSVIGSGIFMKPYAVAQALPGVEWVYGLWIGLGLICLCGAFAYGELGAMFPEAGGQYAFLREGWGRGVGFLYGWVLLLVINTGTLAALAVAFAQYSDSLMPMNDWQEGFLAVGMIFALALTNHFGVAWGALLQNLSTFAKLLALGAIVAAGFFLGGGETRAAVAAVPPSHELGSGIVLAAIAIFWAYEGWYQLPFNAAELRDPSRDLPRGLIYGVAILILTYLLVNAVYLHVVPLDEMRGFESNVQVPVTAVERIFGGGAGAWLAVLMSISVIGSANPNLLSSPRAFYAMAKDGLALRAMTRVHPVYATPTFAIWSQALWAAALVVVLKTFDDLTNYVVFTSLLFYSLTVLAVVRLRRTAPERDRPYRCWGYPITPYAFALVALAVDVQMLFEAEARKNALLGLLILAAGFPVYAWIQRRERLAARGPRSS